MTQPQPSGPPDGVMAAAVLKLTDLAATLARGKTRRTREKVEAEIGRLAGVLGGS